MSQDSQLHEKIGRYLRMLSNDAKIGHALKRLANIDMTVNLLSETGIGKAVNRLKDHCLYGVEAQAIVDKWKKMAYSVGLTNGERKRPASLNRNLDEVPEKKPRKEKKKEREKEKDSSEQNSNGDALKENMKSSISSTKASCSGLSFADVLAAGDVRKPGKSKRFKVDCNDWKLSKVDVNYRPSKVLSFEPVTVIKDSNSSGALDAEMFKPRKSIRKIYAGRPKGDYLREAPTLQSLCIRVLSSNIDAIDEVGDAPYFLLKPVLEKCSVAQLDHIERRNPQLLEDSDELWERFVKRSFPKFNTTNNETWKDCYMRLSAENERKLKTLSTRIQEHNREAVAPVKKTLLADPQAPREIRRRQKRYGTGHIAQALPSASEISKARKEIFCKGSKESFSVLPQSVRNTNSTLSAYVSMKKESPKKGALMQKTLKMLKRRR